MGQKLTMKEQMRRNHRAVKKAVREVEREHKALERNQKKLVADIKKLAKQGQMNAVMRTFATAEFSRHLPSSWARVAYCPTLCGMVPTRAEFARGCV